MSNENAVQTGSKVDQKPGSGHWLEVIRPYVEHGKRVLLLGADKHPLRKGWNDSPIPNPTLGQIEDTLFELDIAGTPVFGFGVVQGPLSGGEYTLDFDNDARATFERFCRDAKEKVGVDVAAMYRTETGRQEGGIHWTFVVTDGDLDERIKAEKINRQCLAYVYNADAKAENEVYCPAIEFKGAGRFVVKPTSIHSKSGKAYLEVNGKGYAPPSLPLAKALELVKLAASYNVKPTEDMDKLLKELDRRLPKDMDWGDIGSGKATGSDFEYSAKDVINRYNSQNPIVNVLERYGYMFASGDFYRHPYNDSALSVHLLDDIHCCHFGANDKVQGYKDSFGLYAAYEHGGDIKAAIRSVSKAFGMDKRKAVAGPQGQAPVVQPPAEPLPNPLIEKARAEKGKVETVKAFASAVKSGDIEKATAALDQAKAILPPQEGTLDAETKKRLDMLQAIIKTPLNLKGLYDKSPLQVKRLTQLLYTHNDIIPSSAHFLTALFLSSALMGKRVVGLNKGRTYYGNQWLCVLAPTASNKSAITSIGKICKGIVNDAPQSSPFAVMQDRFTIAYAFSELGCAVPPKEWNNLSELDQINKRAEIEATCRKKKARLVFADEFSHTFRSILSSGTNDGELGSVLKLADSASEINGSTGTNGYRTIEDCCLSIIGYTQTEMWHKAFDTLANVASGLIGRFFIMNIDDYAPLKVDKLSLSQTECEAEIKMLLKEIVQKVERLPKRLVCDFDADKTKDFCGSIFDAVAQYEEVQAFTSQGLLDLDKFKGKVIAQAIKLTMVHKVLELSEEQIAALNQEGLPQVHTDLLRNERTFAQYVGLGLANLCKLMAAKAPRSESEEIEEKIYNMLLKNPGNKITLRDVLRRNFKLGTYIANAATLREIVGGMEERGIVKTSAGSKGGLVIQWLGKALVF